MFGDQQLNIRAFYASPHLLVQLETAVDSKATPFWRHLHSTTPYTWNGHKNWNTVLFSVHTECYEVHIHTDSKHVKPIRPCGTCPLRSRDPLEEADKISIGTRILTTEDAKNKTESKNACGSRAPRDLLMIGSCEWNPRESGIRESHHTDRGSLHGCLKSLHVLPSQGLVRSALARASETPHFPPGHIPRHPQQPWSPFKTFRHRPENSGFRSRYVNSRLLVSK